MNKIIYSIATVISLIAIFASCSKQETYAEQREREFNKIDEFISKNKIEVIDENTFKSQDYTTKENQYVKFFSICAKGTNSVLLPSSVANALMSSVSSGPSP